MFRQTAFVLFPEELEFESKQQLRTWIDEIVFICLAFLFSLGFLLSFQF